MVVLNGNFAAGCGPGTVKVKVKQSLYRPGRAQRFPEN
jgi:hypothetical protein